jgi:hypothetical protein
VESCKLRYFNSFELFDHTAFSDRREQHLMEQFAAKIPRLCNRPSLRIQISPIQVTANW